MTFTTAQEALSAFGMRYLWTERRGGVVFIDGT